LLLYVLFLQCTLIKMCVSVVVAAYHLTSIIDR